MEPLDKSDRVSSRAFTTYVWLTGQSDNVGDSALRRPYADAIREFSAIRVWAGAIDSGYVPGLRLEPAEIAPSYAAWVSGLLRDAVLQRAGFAFNPGEFSVTRKGFAQILPVLIAVLFIRLAGHPVVWVGAGVKATRRGFTWPFRALARMATILRWREPSSGQRIGVRAPTAPDWAFGIAGESENRTRPYLAVSLRGDRKAPPPEWLEAVKSLSERLGLKLVTVTQVRRDDTRLKEVALALGSDTVGWLSDDLFEQEEIAREVYSKSSIILSDRLHALIIGATEGAVPLGWMWEPNEKIKRHFSTVGMHDVSVASDAGIAALNSLDGPGLRSRSEELRTMLKSARTDLDSVVFELLPEKLRR